MYKHAMQRCFEIVCRQPSKVLVAFTPAGWRRFAALIQRTGFDDAERLAARRSEFQSDAWDHSGPVSVRRYATYADYIKHQKSKLDSLGGQAYAKPEKAVQMFRRRFELVKDLPQNASVLCLGARCGEEVRAFIELGHLALGIDLNPGTGAEHVVTGDFHALDFGDHSVDCIYVNCLDHALDLHRILTEVRRVLKRNGIFIVDINFGYEEGYSAGYHDAMHWKTARAFGEHLAEIGKFRLESFRDLEAHGSKFWTQTVLRPN